MDVLNIFEASTSPVNIHNQSVQSRDRGPFNSRFCNSRIFQKPKKLEIFSLSHYAEKTLNKVEKLSMRLRWMKGHESGIANTFCLKL